MKASRRLKNFCQLCRKLCKDQNGYICHLNSVSHRKKEEEYKNNPQQIIEKYSEQMLQKFIQIIKTKYPGEPKHLEVIYKEYEQQNKRFIKFSSTRWKNLKQFGDFLVSERVKNIKITGEPPDCYITYTLNKTMDFIQKNKKEQMNLLKEREKELFQKSMQNRISRQKALQQRQLKRLEQQLKQEEQNRQQPTIPDKLQFKFDCWDLKRNAFVTVEDLQKQNAKEHLDRLNSISQITLSHKKLENASKLLSKLVAQQENKNKSKSYTDGGQSQKNKKKFLNQELSWVQVGIIVKIRPHDIDSVFHDKKTKIIELTDQYTAKVEVGTATLQIDQTFLQTVIPKVGNQVMVLIGQSKGKIGKLEKVDLSEGSGTIKIQQSNIKVPFNYFSKYQSSNTS